MGPLPESTFSSPTPSGFFLRGVFTQGGLGYQHGRIDRRRLCMAQAIGFALLIGKGYGFLGAGGRYRFQGFSYQSAAEQVYLSFYLLLASLLSFLLCR